MNIGLSMGGANLLTLLTSLLAIGLVYARSRRNRTPPYPPGPHKHPFLGNLLDMPTKFEWETYTRWSKEHNSDIIHLQAAGHDVIVLHSFESAMELLDKRSVIYSSRPRFTMVSELMGYEWFLPGLPYDKEWKERRRLFQKYFSNRNVAVFQATQREFVHKMLPQLLEKPRDFIDITGHMVGGSTISLAYGLDIKDSSDPFVNLANQGIQSVAQAGAPGAFLVDLIPMLKYVPEWVPGAGFKKTARIWRRLQEDVREMPFAEAVKNMSSGKAKPCFVSECLESLDGKQGRGYQVDIIKDTAGAVFAAGSDTTLSAIHSFFVAMLYFPEVQTKAQEELDRVLKGRLPDFGDETDLPYLAALVKEVLRWKTLTPLGVPHYASEDDVYRGYFIPKGAIMITNAWAILHDEEHYPDSHIFKPKRFLKDNGQLNPAAPDPSLVVFGFGRRLCPGRHVAASLLWLTVATILVTFQISKAVDDDGLPIEPSVEYQSGLLYHPLPFKCTIKPRSKAAEELIRSVENAR